MGVEYVRFVEIYIMQNVIYKTQNSNMKGGDYYET